jgi:omega-6 fatty acid desaturase (delta-12 desaturase)
MHELPSRAGKALIDATRPFAREDRARSWFHVATTLAALCSAIAIAAAAPWWPVRVAGAVLEALLLLRAFILYHDHMHGALLRDSAVGGAVLRAAGVLMLAPPQVWADSHNAHHANTARLAAPPTGTYSLWTLDRWEGASWGDRLRYRLERHPITMLFGYLTVFLVALCILPFVQKPRRHASSGLAVAVHAALSIAVCASFGVGVYVTTILAPFTIACGIGSYLFYAQHNAPGVELRAPAAWAHDDAALRGSTHLVTGPLMSWFIGNIGLHHVHHLNARIPFYRLPEAMAALPELQDPVVTTLWPRDIRACLRLALWEATAGRLVSLSETSSVRSASHPTRALRELAAHGDSSPPPSRRATQGAQGAHPTQGPGERPVPALPLSRLVDV